MVLLRAQEGGPGSSCSLYTLAQKRTKISMNQTKICSLMAQKGTRHVPARPDLLQSRRDSFFEINILYLNYITVQTVQPTWFLRTQVMDYLLHPLAAIAKYPHCKNP